jgi:cytoskeletal protein CcmA (bactofilin family)
MIMSKNKKVFASHHSLLCASTRVQGDIYFSGDFYLEGALKGNIYAEEGKSAKLIVTETGSIEGDVHVPSAIIVGRVVGTIYSTKHLELAAKAIVEGAIHYHSIEMVKGSQLIGQMTCTATTASSAAPEIKSDQLATAIVD